MVAWFIFSLIRIAGGALLGAIVLRAAVSLVCDTELEYGQAYMYTVIAGVINLVMNTGLLLAMGDTLAENEWLNVLLPLLITLPVCGGVYGFLIQDDRGTGAIGFVKGLVVTLTIILCYLLMSGFFMLIGLMFHAR